MKIISVTMLISLLGLTSVSAGGLDFLDNLINRIFAVWDPCSSHSDCDPGEYCYSNTCFLQKTNGEYCTENMQCQSLQCIDSECTGSVPTTTTTVPSSGGCQTGCGYCIGEDIGHVVADHCSEGYFTVCDVDPTGGTDCICRNCLTDYSSWRYSSPPICTEKNAIRACGDNAGCTPQGGACGFLNNNCCEDLDCEDGVCLVSVIQPDCLNNGRRCQTGSGLPCCDGECLPYKDPFVFWITDYRCQDPQSVDYCSELSTESQCNSVIGCTWDAIAGVCERDPNQGQDKIWNFLTTYWKTILLGIGIIFLFSLMDKGGVGK
jgi:hypothetical protein